MGDLTRYNPAQVNRSIQQSVEMTTAVQQEIGRLYQEGTDLAAATLTYTNSLIHDAASRGMSQAEVVALVEQQKLYLARMRQIAVEGATELNHLITRPDRLLGG